MDKNTLALALLLGSLPALTCAAERSGAADAALQAPAAAALPAAAPVPQAAQRRSGTKEFVQDLDDGHDEAVLGAYLHAASELSVDPLTNASLDLAAAAIDGIDFGRGSITLTFDEQKLRESLLKQGTVIWDGLDNPVLVWMAAAESGVDNLVAGDNLTELAAKMMENAAAHKYRLMFPLLDLDDIQNISAAAVREHDNTAAAAAGSRYGADYIVRAASTLNDSGVMQLEWQVLDQNGRVLGEEVREGSLTTLAEDSAALIGRVLMQQAERQALAGRDTDQEEENVNYVSQLNLSELGPGDGFVRMVVTGIDNLRDYRRFAGLMVTYGFDEVRWAGRMPDGDVVEVVTNSNPEILRGTMTRSGDFTSLSAWQFAFSGSGARAVPERLIGRADPTRPDSSFLDQVNLGSSAD